MKTAAPPARVAAGSAAPPWTAARASRQGHRQRHPPDRIEPDLGRPCRLTRIELAFAVLIAAAAAGLMLALGFEDRRRAFAVLSAIGARARTTGGLPAGRGRAGAVGGLCSASVTAPGGAGCWSNC